MNLYCPACGETARNTPPPPPYPRGVKVPRHSHHDGTPLCPKIGQTGYEPHWPLQRDLDLRTLPRGRYATPAHHPCRGPAEACARSIDTAHDICVALRHDDIHLPMGAPGFARSLDARHSRALADWLHANTDHYLHLIPEHSHEHAHRLIVSTVEWLNWCARFRGFKTHTHQP